MRIFDKILCYNSLFFRYGNSYGIYVLIYGNSYGTVVLDTEIVRASCSKVWKWVWQRCIDMECSKIYGIL